MRVLHTKTVRWQIPFVSRNGKKYRIDIYDEGTHTPVQLTGGTTPFVTNEDSSDDFFHPLRAQTGTIQVCTLMPNGNYITLDDMLPANNIARPVRLMEEYDPTLNRWRVAWQGFLSCEAYSQHYQSTPQILELPVISVLEAMDSVEIQLNESMAFKTIIGHIAYAMRAIERESWMDDLIHYLYISDYCHSAIISKYIYNNVYFDTTEMVSGDNIIVDVHSLSVKKILEQIAQFFGCCWREVGQDFYLEAMGKMSYKYKYQEFDLIYSKYVTGTTIGDIFIETGTVDFDIFSQFEWMGTGHQRSISQGMRRVKVTAKLKDFECEMSLHDTPVNNLVVNPSERWSVNGEVHVNTNETFYNFAEHKHYLTKATFPTDLSRASLQLMYSLQDIRYEDTIFWATNELRQYYEDIVIWQTKGSNSGINYYLTSFMAYWRDLDNKLQSGLMICGIPKYLYFSAVPVQARPWDKYALTQSNYLYRQTMPLNFAAASGYMKIDINTLAWSNAVGDMPSGVEGTTVHPKLTIALQFGGYWLYEDNGDYKWGTTFSTIDFPMEEKRTNGLLKTKSNWDESMGIEESDGLFVSIPEFMTGFVSIYVYPYVDAISTLGVTNGSGGMFDVFITKLDVSYVKVSEELATDRNENVYLQETSKYFRDELSVDCDMASDANNNKLATMIWDDANTPAKLITLGAATVRPEADLLNRLAEYYSVVRQKLNLETDSIIYWGVLPKLVMKGEDSKEYTPIEDSRDWKLHKSTFILIENT